MLMMSLYDSIYLRRKIKFNSLKNLYYLDNSEFIIVENKKQTIILIIKELNQIINPHICYHNTCFTSCNYNKNLVYILIDGTHGWVSKNDFIKI